MLTHQGRVRKGNEDWCAADPELGAFVVCDGMGGAAAGEVASRMAAEVFLQVLDDTAAEAQGAARLEVAIHSANRAVFEQSRRDVHMHGMGTTLVALLLEQGAAGGTPGLLLAHVGDSRCYRFRDGLLRQLTDDHSLVEEQVRMGEMTKEEAEFHPMRNIITRAVGSQPEVEAEIQRLRPQAGDLYVLASDGLNRELTDAHIAATIRFFEASRASEGGSEPLDLGALCQALIERANDAGGGDNITALVLQIL